MLKEKKKLKCWFAFRCLWTGFFQTWFVSSSHWILQFGTALDSLEVDLHLKSQMQRRAKTSGGQLCKVVKCKAVWCVSANLFEIINTSRISLQVTMLSTAVCRMAPYLHTATWAAVKSMADCAGGDSFTVAALQCHQHVLRGEGKFRHIQNKRKETYSGGSWQRY